jgi:hypothetical protein
MDVALDDQRDGVPELAVAEPDLELGEVLGPVTEVDQASDQGGIDLVLVAELCRARHSRAYAELRIMPSRARAELVPGSRPGRMTLNSSA